jgi:hypothetical protein
MVMINIPSNAHDTRNKYNYDLGEGIPTVFKIFENLQFKGDRTTPYGHDIHNIRCYLTYETRIYMVKGWGYQRFLRYTSQNF